ncbi:GNAT family N-acetyltransferase [Clavibacter michiganensis]|uniref:GNAT family N-acetyltransferase n=1 Tax=Clavibacter michiganensis TaxID=28447 RepID=A0A2S5VXM2_9MICO|nr:GNAT family N-acetyltransferase [Clavibacter michiganensis]
MTGVWRSPPGWPGRPAAGVRAARWVRMVDERIEVVRHEDLSRTRLEQLQVLFDHEYLDDHGPWTPDAPYGYSPADVHVLVTHGSELAAHAGFQRRVIAVGVHDVAVGGTGGVLVSERARGGGLGGRLMSRLARTMRSTAGVEYGYLGCRPEVAPFYASSGWRPVAADERSRSRRDGTVVVTTDDPILILPVTRAVSAWPAGVIDLRGTPW